MSGAVEPRSRCVDPAGPLPPIAQEDLDPMACRRLWVAVLVLAVRDASAAPRDTSGLARLGRYRARERNGRIDQACASLLGRDGEVLCSLAGVDHGRLCDEMRKGFPRARKVSLTYGPKRCRGQALRLHEVTA